MTVVDWQPVGRVFKYCYLHPKFTPFGFDVCLGDSAKSITIEGCCTCDPPTLISQFKLLSCCRKRDTERRLQLSSLRQISSFALVLMNRSVSTQSVCSFLSFPCGHVTSNCSKRSLVPIVHLPKFRQLDLLFALAEKTVTICCTLIGM